MIRTLHSEEEDAMEVESATAQSCLARLDAIAAEMAEAIVPLLESVTPETYREVLSVCFHYTHSSGAQWNCAAALAPTDDLRRLLRGNGGRGTRSLPPGRGRPRSAGESVRASRPAAVDRFAEYWNAITRANYFEFLGGNLRPGKPGRPVREQVVRAMAVLGLNRRQNRFVRTHLEADVEHGQRVAEFCAIRAGEWCGDRRGCRDGRSILGRGSPDVPRRESRFNQLAQRLMTGEI